MLLQMAILPLIGINTVKDIFYIELFNIIL